jgi:tRNA A-37 threonylcarbamoyl transferase component Bud32
MLVGQSIGPFHVEKELGSGAMGKVYRATLVKEGKTKRYAVKVIAPGLGDNERIQARFDRETKILKDLKHPNIVRLVAHGKFHSRPFYAMEYIEGHSLDYQLAKQGRFSWEKVIELAKQVCAALQFAHDSGIIHRDLKPSNLMVDRNGTLKLTDFGIAKDNDMSGLTSANSTVGTAAYMSPEQCRGERDLTPKSDLYALGVVLYELLTGRKPFQAENAMDMFIQHVSGTFERPARLVMDIPPWLDNLVCQLLEKKPEHRPSDAVTVAKALDDVKDRVEARKSLGAEVASTIARKGASRDKELAQDILSGKRIKKRRARTRAQLRKQLLAASGLLIALALTVGLLIYALQPPDPGTLLQKAEQLITQGDAALSKEEYFLAFEAWNDAEKNYLAEILKRYPDSPEATKAQQDLDYVKAAQKYRMGLERLEGKPALNWQLALRYGWSELLSMKPSVAKHFSDLARDQLQPYDAPYLLTEAKSKADPNNEKGWEDALRKLELLADRYPNASEIKEGVDIYSRLDVQKNTLEKLRQNKLLQDLDWQRRANDFEKEAAQALNDELQEKKEEAKKLWQHIHDRGQEKLNATTKYIDDPRYRPWILLANAKLESPAK